MSGENSPFGVAGGGGGGKGRGTSNRVTIHDDNATPCVISPAGVPGDAKELPNGDVGVSGDVAAGVPGVSAGGVSGVVVAVVPGGVAAGGLPGAIADPYNDIPSQHVCPIIFEPPFMEPITIAPIPTILLVLIKRRSLDGRENSFVSLKRRKLILLQMLWLLR